MMTSDDSTSDEPRHMKKRWSADEDSKLAQLVENAPAAEKRTGDGKCNFIKINWSKLSRKMENRTAKQCRERYINSLKPDGKKGQWTEEEDENIIRMQAEFGNQWSKISSIMPGRSDNDVKNRWHSKMRSQNIKRTITLEASVDAAPAHEKKRAKLKSPGLRIPGKPKVGQRVRVKSNKDGLFEGGTIKEVFKRVQTHHLEYKLTICNDDGAHVEAVYPSLDVQLIPTKSKLSASEVSLCHELFNVQGTVKKPIEADIKIKAKCSEVETHVSRQAAGSMKGNRGGVETNAFMSADIDSLADIVAREAARSMKGRSGGDIETCAFMSADIDSLSNIVAGRMHKKGELSIFRAVDAVEICPPLKDPPQASTSDSSFGTKTVDGDLDAVLWDGVSKWPMSGIQKPGDNDCLIGRGGGTNHHTGNIRWRLIVGDKKKGYKSSPRNGKPLIAMEIVRIWRNQSPPGRFLKLNEQTGLWDDVGDEDSRIKCLQALRERKESKLRLSTDRIGSTCLLPGDDSAPDDFGSGEAAEL